MEGSNRGTFSHTSIHGDNPLVATADRRNTPLVDHIGLKERSIFENSIATVIREMEAVRHADPGSALIYLIDAANQIAELQRTASLATDLELRDEHK